MFFTATRHAFSTTARASIRSARSNVSSIRIGGKRMNSSHATPKKSSDKPWIIGSSLIFGPAFLYLISPSARQKSHQIHSHNDAHDFPGHKESKTNESAKEPEPAQPAQPAQVKEEDTKAGTTDQNQQDKGDDTPKVTTGEPTEPEHASDAQDGPSENHDAKTEDEAKNSDEQKQTHEARPDEKHDQSFSDSGPTNMGEAREASKEGASPKEKSEEAEETKEAKEAS